MVLNAVLGKNIDQYLPPPFDTTMLDDSFFACRYAVHEQHFVSLL